MWLKNAQPLIKCNSCSVYIATWNVSSKSPDAVHLPKLLGLEKNPENDLHRPDIYVIGYVLCCIDFVFSCSCNNLVIFSRLQEINAQPQSVVKGLFRNDPWALKFKDLLKDRGYVSIKSEQMQGLLLLLFAKRQHLLHVRQVESEYTRTGLAGIWVIYLDMRNYGTI